MGLRRFEYTQVHMGGAARIVLFCGDRRLAESAARAAFGRIAEIEQVCSDYRRDSEVVRLCDRAGEGWIAISRDLYRVLEVGQRIAQASNGAFDITLGPLVALWRRMRQTGQMATEADLAAAKSLKGWQKLRLRPGFAMLETPGMRIDLGGIAKGFACDEALMALRRHGFDRAMIEMGGDLRFGCAPPFEPGWKVRAGSGRSLRMDSCGLSTSGDSEQFVEIGGQRFAHILDPRTGLGLSRPVQATVEALSGLFSDPIATAVCVLGKSRGASLARRFSAKMIEFRGG